MTTTAQYEAVFDSMDTDGSGQVDGAEMKRAMMARGFGEADMERFFGAADVSGDGKVTRKEFLTAMGCASDEEIRKACWRRAFLGFDKDKNGTVNKAELKMVMEEAGKEFSEDEISRMMAMIDTSGDEVVTYDEFINRFCG